MYQLLAALLAVTPAAEPSDVAKIRELLELPNCESLTSLGLDSSGRVILPDSDAYLAGDCAAAERAVQANPGDPDRLRVLADLYGRLNEGPKATSAAAKAAKLYEAALLKQPGDGLMLAHYAKCLPWNERLDEADTALRRAVALSPKESECWRIRAEVILARSARGLGTCVEVSIAGYPEIVRAQLAIPAELTILCGLAIGYPDPEFAANGLHVKREPIEKNVAFLDN
jgi:nitroreductase